MRTECLQLSGGEAQRKSDLQFPKNRILGLSKPEKSPLLTISRHCNYTAMALIQGSTQLCSDPIILEGLSTLPWKCFDRGGYYFKALKHELENLASASSFEERFWLFSACDLDLKAENIDSELLSKNLKMTPRVAMKSRRIVSGLQQLRITLEKNDTKKRKLCSRESQSAFD